jgi:hypothetical protein
MFFSPADLKISATNSTEKTKVNFGDLGELSYEFNLMTPNGYYKKLTTQPASGVTYYIYDAETKQFSTANSWTDENVYFERKTEAFHSIKNNPDLSAHFSVLADGSLNINLQGIIDFWQQASEFGLYNLLTDIQGLLVFNLLIGQEKVGIKIL